MRYRVKPGARFASSSLQVPPHVRGETVEVVDLTPDGDGDVRVETGDGEHCYVHLTDLEPYDPEVTFSQLQDAAEFLDLTQEFDKIVRAAEWKAG